jgi:hypothetical protein
MADMDHFNSDEEDAMRAYERVAAQYREAIDRLASA